ELTTHVAPSLAVHLVTHNVLFAVRSGDACHTRDTLQSRSDVRAASIHLQVHRFRTAKPRGEVVWCINRDDPSPIDDDDALTRLADFGQDVRAENNRVVTRQRLDQLTCLCDFCW